MEFESIDQIPEQLRPFFAEITNEDGTVVHQFNQEAFSTAQQQSDAYKTQVAELQKEIASLKKANKKAPAPKGSPEPAKNEPGVDDATSARLAGLEKSLQALQTENLNLKGVLVRDRLDNALVEAFRTAGGIESAKEDALGRASKVFKLDDTLTPIARDDNGADIMSKKDPTKPMSIEEYMIGLKDTAPHLFKRSVSGSGVGGVSGGSSKTEFAENPFITKDYCALAELKEKDPVAYNRYKVQYENSKRNKD